jgi:hypothetical protein
MPLTGYTPVSRGADSACRTGDVSMSRIDVPGNRPVCRTLHVKGRCTGWIPIQRFPILLRKLAGERWLPMCAHRQEIRNEAQCAQDHKQRKAEGDDDGKY